MIHILLPQDAINRFCKKWKIKELALFGSVLRDDFCGDSDIDVLVSFYPEAEWTLFDHVNMQDELKKIINRDIDLITRRGIESSRNNLRRNEILNSAEVIYAAA